MRFDFAQFVENLGTNLALPKTTTSKYDNWSDAELTELFDERAAIAEFDGGMKRGEADSDALNWIKGEIGERKYKVWASKPKSV